MKEINSYGFNMADDTRKVRVEERLKIKIGEAKNLPARSHGAPSHRDTYCVLSLDQEEIFRTSTMERTLNPFFGEEFQFEVPRRFRYLSLYVFDRDKHLKQDKVLGKVAIKREDLHRYNNKDHWFALRPVDADSEVQGKAYIELTLEDSRKRLRVEPKPPDPDPPGDNCPSKAKANNLSRISEYCKESIRFGSTNKKCLSSAATEPSLALSRSESLKDRAQWPARTKPPLHARAGRSAGVEPESAEGGDAGPDPTSADYWSDPERHCTARTGPDTIRLRVHECSELTTKNGQCDPFAMVTVIYSNGGRVERRTKVRKKTVNPQFNEIFCFDVVMESDPKDKDGTQSRGVAAEARVSVWHEAATPVFLGEVRLPLRQPAPAAPSAWYFLSSRGGVGGAGGAGGGGGTTWRGATPPGTRLSAAGSAGAALGSLRLLLQYTVDHVFPLQHYRRLQELFLASVRHTPITTSAVYILGEIVSNKTDAAQPLVRLFTHHDLIVPIVKELADAEISALTDATTIFRGNTLVSKMMDEAMRLSGAGYLRAVLRPTLAAVLAERRPCEIDPARVKPAAAVHANLANLKDYVEKVFAAITSSYAQCPAAMCRLFDALRQCAARHFPQHAEVRYSVVSGFIFLRFFAPAILGPKLFDLTNEQIDPQTNRTLTLISKTIQSLGNLVSSRSAQQVCKEEYMAELYRSFCTTRHVQAIRQFLEIISTTSDTQNNNVQEIHVLLKEGTMYKRSEGIRGSGAGGSPRRRWPRAAHAHAKRRHFRLTSRELSWSRCGAKSPAHRLPLSGVLAVEAVDHPPADAPLGANNIFKIIHKERELFVQAGNCVERAEWVRLLSALCRAPPPQPAPAAPPPPPPPPRPAHAGYYGDGEWTCCKRAEAGACGCDGDGEGCGGDAATRLALRLDPARDLQRLHALLVQHAHHLDDRLHRNLQGTLEEREAEAATLRDLQEAMFDLEHRHRIYRRSLVRETKYGSKQAPIGDDNYLHLAGGACGAGAEGGPFLWRTWRGNVSPASPTSPTAPDELVSSSESLKLSRHADTRCSGKSMGGGYLTMSCLRREPEEEADPPLAARPARPPPPPPPCEYVDMEPRPPERRPKHVCREYELMADFMSHARCPAPAPDTTPLPAPPLVPPRRPHEPKPPPHRTVVATVTQRDSDTDIDKNDADPAPFESKFDTISNDDSLLEELREDTRCELRVCEDETDVASSDPVEREDGERCEGFSRISLQRKSNPIKSQSAPRGPLKTSNSASNVNEARWNGSRPIVDRLTLSFLKRKPKPAEERASKSKEENLIVRLTPRFGASRLMGRGRSLELQPPRAIDSSVVAHSPLFTLHRYGARDDHRPLEPAADRKDTARDDIRL